MAAERKKPPTERSGGKACCMVSEVLEEAGLDRTHIRAIRRQVLQGLMLFCQWQLDRMDEPPRPPKGGRGARKVAVE